MEQVVPVVVNQRSREAEQALAEGDVDMALRCGAGPKVGLPANRGMMAKHSRNERERRKAAAERVVEIERAWRGSVPASVAAKFDEQVRASKERGPLPPPPDMAPGTKPNPPRPGREPKPPKADERPRRF